MISEDQSESEWGSERRLSLPSKTDQLFSSQEDWWNNACLNWCRNGWSLYADGYKEAADILVDKIESSRSGQDALVYPILFLYRQYLELAIKEIIREAMSFQDAVGTFPKHHKIDSLWQDCHSRLSQIFPGNSPDALREVGRLIGEFAAVDPTSMAFRYPEDKDGNASLPGMSIINVRQVRDVIGRISVILSGASIQLGEWLGMKRDYQNEYRGE